MAEFESGKKREATKALSAEASLSAEKVLYKAALRAASELGLSESEAQTALRGALREGPSADAFCQTTAFSFVGIFRNLNAICGADQEKCQAWLEARNDHLSGASPQELLTSPSGRKQIAQYLDEIVNRKPA